MKKREQRKSKKASRSSRLKTGRFFWERKKECKYVSRMRYQTQTGRRGRDVRVTHLAAGKQQCSPLKCVGQQSNEDVEHENRGQRQPRADQDVRHDRVHFLHPLLSQNVMCEILQDELQVHFQILFLFVSKKKKKKWSGSFVEKQTVSNGTFRLSKK